MFKLSKAQSLLTLALLLGIGVFVVAPVVKAADDVNLIFHWNLNEGSGTTALDGSGNGYDGTLYNGATYTTGHEGTGVQLNGIDQYVQTPTPFGFLGTVDQPYALSAWVNIAQPNASGNIFHMSSEVDGSGWCIPFLTLKSGQFTATGWDNNGQVDATDPATAAVGQWHQVISTWDATNGLRLFVDGELVAATPQSEYAASGSAMYASLGIGAAACSNNQGYFNGVIDDARIYSRALVAADIEEIANEGTPAAVVTPAAPVDDTSGAVSAPNTGAAPHQSGSDVVMVVFATAALILAILATIFAHRRLKL